MGLIIIVISASASADPYIFRVISYRFQAKCQTCPDLSYRPSARISTAVGSRWNTSDPKTQVNLMWILHEQQETGILASLRQIRRKMVGEKLRSCTLENLALAQYGTGSVRPYLACTAVLSPLALTPIVYTFALRHPRLTFWDLLVTSAVVTAANLHFFS